MICKKARRIEDNVYELEFEGYFERYEEMGHFYIKIPKARISVNENNEIEIDELLSDPIFEVIEEE